MADAAAATATVTVDKEGKPTAQASKGLSMKLVLMIGLGALLIGLGVAVAVIKFGGSSQSSDQATTKSASSHGAAAEKSMENRGVSTAIFDMDPFIVNLADTPEIRYLKLTVKLDLERAEVKDEITARLPQVRDAILILLSSKDAASLRTTQAKFQLRDEITSRVNNALPRTGVKTAYFTEFIVQ